MSVSTVAQKSGPSEQVIMRLKLICAPMRLGILGQLENGEAHVGLLCERLSFPQPQVSLALTMLRLGGLVEFQRNGKNVVYRLTGSGAIVMAAVRAIEGA